MWAYVTLGVTGIITEEATPLIGGLAAHTQRLRLSLVCMWVAGGTYAADLGLYYLGRWRGDWARKRWPHLRSFMIRALRIVRRHPWRSSVAVRWAWGLRLTLPVACGAARLPITIYAIGSAISCLTWACVFTLLGWAFGEATLRVLGHVRRYENTLIVIILVTIAVVFLVLHARQGEVEEEMVSVLASGDPEPAPVAGDQADDR